MRSLIVCCCLALTPLHAAHALKEFAITDQGRVVAPIARGMQNRLAVKGDRINQIFGSHPEVAIETDEVMGQIFLAVSEGLTDPFYLTITTEGGITQDLKLIALQDEPETILLVPSVVAAHSQTNSVSYEQQLMAWIQSLAHGTLNKDFVMLEEVKTPSKLTALPKDTKVTLDKAYKNGAYSLVSYTVHNGSKESLHLHEKSLSDESTLALALTAQTLEPGQTATFYRIAKLPGGF